MVVRTFPIEHSAAITNPPENPQWHTNYWKTQKTAQILPTPDTTTSKGARPNIGCKVSKGAHSRENTANPKGGDISYKGGYIISKGA